MRLPARWNPPALDRHPVAVYLSSLAEGSRRAMHSALQQFTSELTQGAVSDPLQLDWPAVEYQHLQAIRTRLSDQGYAPATTNKMLSATKGVLKQTWLLGLISSEHYHRAAAVPQAKGSRVAAGRSITREELDRLSEIASVRDRAIIAVAYAGGLRRAEIAALGYDDVDRLKGEIKVRGKGNRERTVYLANGALEALRRWCAERGDYAGALFFQKRTGRRLSSEGIYRIIKRLAARAGLPPMSPHDLRRTVAGDMLDNGTDLVTVQKILGHASPTTTGRYDRRSERTKQQAAQGIDL